MFLLLPRCGIRRTFYQVLTFRIETFSSEFRFPVDDHLTPLVKWSGRKDSNLRPPGPKPGALPG